MITKDTLIEIKTLARVSQKSLIKADDFALKAAIIACNNIKHQDGQNMSLLPVSLHAGSSFMSLSNIAMRLVLLGFDESEILKINTSFEKEKVDALKKQLQLENETLVAESQKLCIELNLDDKPELLRHSKAIFKHVFAVSLSAYIYADAITVSLKGIQKSDAFEKIFFDKMSKDLLLEPPSASFLIAALSHDTTLYLSAALLITGASMIALSLLPAVGMPILAFAGLSAIEGVVIGAVSSTAAVGLFTSAYVAKAHQKSSLEKMQNARDMSLLGEADEIVIDESNVEGYQTATP